MTDEREQAVREQSALDAALAIVDDFGAHRRDAYFARFAPEATFVFYTAGARVESRAAYEELWAGWERDAGFQVISCTSSNQRVQLAGEVAIFTHDVETALRMDGATETVHERETIVLQQRGDGWSCIHEHLSPAGAAATTTA